LLRRPSCSDLHTEGRPRTGQACEPDPDDPGAHEGTAGALGGDPPLRGLIWRCASRTFPLLGYARTRPGEPLLPYCACVSDCWFPGSPQCKNIYPDGCGRHDLGSFASLDLYVFLHYFCRIIIACFVAGSSICTNPLYVTTAEMYASYRASSSPAQRRLTGKIWRYGGAGDPPEDG
jgi:hypothetical protein